MIDPSSSEEESEGENIQPLPNERGRHQPPAYGPGRGLEVPNATPRWEFSYENYPKVPMGTWKLTNTVKLLWNYPILFKSLKILKNLTKPSIKS